MKIPKDPKIVLAGSVNSSRKTLEKLIEHKMNVTGVLGLSPSVSQNVSGFNDLRNLAEVNDLNFKYFERINDSSTVEFVKKAAPDLFFVVGLSQLILNELLKLPTVGCVGYHPTMLPEGRGRAAIAWIILGKAKPAATFFMIDEGIDSGDIIGQIPVTLKGDEYPQEVIDKVMDAIGKVLDGLLPELKNGILIPRKQDDSKATYLGRRKPEDGLIDWDKPAIEIANLVRAVSKPLPGAFTYVSAKKVVIWKASAKRKSQYIGEPGRIAAVENNTVIVHTGDGILNIEEFEGASLDEFKIGKKLGIDLLNIANKLNLIEL